MNRNLLYNLCEIPSKTYEEEKITSFCEKWLAENCPELSMAKQESDTIH